MARRGAPLPRSSPGQVVGGKWRIVAPIGRGGMGAVYEGQNISIGKKVALKFIDAEFARQPDVASRFQREAEAASLVESAHIVQIFDSGATDDGIPYIVMELLRGEDLRRAAQDASAGSPNEEAVHVDGADAARPAPRARSGNRPPRSQAGQHLPRRSRRRPALRQDRRLRHLQDDAPPRRSGGTGTLTRRASCWGRRSTCRPSRRRRSRTSTSAPISGRWAPSSTSAWPGKRLTAATRTSRSSSRSARPMLPIFARSLPEHPRAPRRVRQQGADARSSRRFQSAKEMLDALAGHRIGSSLSTPPTAPLRPSRPAIRSSRTPGAARERRGDTRELYAGRRPHRWSPAVSHSTIRKLARARGAPPRARRSWRGASCWRPSFSPSGSFEAPEVACTIDLERVCRERLGTRAAPASVLSSGPVASPALLATAPPLRCRPLLAHASPASAPPPRFRRESARRDRSGATTTTTVAVPEPATAPIRSPPNPRPSRTPTGHRRGAANQDHVSLIDLNHLQSIAARIWQSSRLTMSSPRLRRTALLRRFLPLCRGTAFLIASCAFRLRRGASRYRDR